MKTIIQTIGPLYGDVVNGSVFGQPNGSIAVNPNRIWTDLIATDYVYIKTDNGTKVCDVNGDPGTAAVVSFTTQVLTHCFVFLYSDSACTTSLGYITPANSVGFGKSVSVKSFKGGITIVQGTKYYGRVEARIGDSTGPIVVASEVFEFTGL